MDHPDGLMLKTRESEDFLVLNGIQTQSARVHNLIDELPRMQRMGVAVARISPQAQHTRSLPCSTPCAGRAGAKRCPRATPALVPDQSCNGYWHGHNQAWTWWTGHADQPDTHLNLSEYQQNVSNALPIKRNQLSNLIQQRHPKELP